VIVRTILSHQSKAKQSKGLLYVLCANVVGRVYLNNVTCCIVVIATRPTSSWPEIANMIHRRMPKLGSRADKIHSSIPSMRKKCHKNKAITVCFNADKNAPVLQCKSLD